MKVIDFQTARPLSRYATKLNFPNVIQKNLNECGNYCAKRIRKYINCIKEENLSKSWYNSASRSFPS